MNRLAHETSPYLQQHSANPVDWYPWGSEALERAKREDKPILLSVGYAACHWCHVMAHESFEDDATASVMNEHFVNIKVDREERPDLDSIYMQAVQAMTGQGGWPMTAFLRPDGAPFYCGTYFPPEDRHGLPSFRRVLAAVAESYRARRSSVDDAVARMREVYDAGLSISRSTGALTERFLARAYRTLVQSYDTRYAGFGGAPKFPPSMSLDFLLRHWARTGTERSLEMVAQTFRAMAHGGIYDQVGGGFHRYAVDGAWQVPHFEKMLYDNALLARLGVHLWQATGDAEVRRVTEETIDWVAREMTSPRDAFYSSLDADSEGVEGKFYLWDANELDDVLGNDAPAVRAYWGVSKTGNFEGRNILHVPDGIGAAAARVGTDEATVRAALARSRSVLGTVRGRRVWPGRDEKILAGWNALMLRAVAEAARVFGRDDYRALALGNGRLLRDELVRNGRVARVLGSSTSSPIGFLEDQAAVGLAFLDLYSLTFDTAWLREARAIADATIEWFWDDQAKAFFDTARDHEALITRPRDVTDNAMPSGNSLAVELMLRIAELTGDEAARHHGEWVLETLAEPMARYPSGFGHLLGAADLALHGAVEVALVGDPAADDFGALAAEVTRRYVPSLVLAGGAPNESNDVALLAGREARDGAATAYVCRRYTCEAPTTSAVELAEQLLAAGRSLVSSR
jgi:uncharacterized protein YyaL (SSP411 family)